MIVADRPAPAALRDISGNGAFLETNARPALDSRISFHHPEAGMIDARVLSGRGDVFAVVSAAEVDALHVPIGDGARLGQ